jgi:hypothetical protein
VATGTSRATLQFSIFSLMAVTLVVALLCGAVRALVVWLGESAEILISLVDEAPLLICWAVGIWIAIARWQMHPSVSLLAVIGLGLMSVVLLVGQLFWMVLIRSVPRPMEFSLAVSLLLSALSSIALGLVVTAALSWRNDRPSRVAAGSPFQS